MTPVYQKLKKAEHGGKRNETRHFLDFSSNLNPCAPILDWNIPEESIRAYPDDSYNTLREIIARHHHRSPEEICVGNGSVEVIRTLCHTIAVPGTTVYVPGHTFSEYALSAQLAGAHITHSPDAQAEISFLCNPDNPSGIVMPRCKVMNRLSQISDSGGLLCVDEAFIDLAEPAESVSEICNSHLFVLRSLTKTFSMAGVRFGYGIGDADLVEAMEVMRPPWTVNAFAQAMAIQAFEKYPALEGSRQYVSRERSRISNRCRELGLIPSPSSTNYLLLDTGRNVANLTECMKKQGILVRDCTSFGLPACIRVAIKKEEENDMLLEALDRCLH